MYYPIISVIVTANDTTIPSCLEEALDSILMQSYPHWEILLVSNATLPIIKKSIKKYTELDARISSSTITLPHTAELIQYGIRKARGEWTCILNPEDIYVQDRFTTFIEHTFEYPSIEIFCTEYIIKDETTNTTYIAPSVHTLDTRLQYSPFSFMRTNTILMSSAFIKTKVFAKTNFFEPTIEYEYAFNFLLRASIQHQIICISIPLCFHRIHEQSMTTTAPYSLQFDMGRTCVTILQQHTVRELLTQYPLHTLEEHILFFTAIVSTALHQDSIIYYCGTTTILLDRITEWLSTIENTEYKTALLEHANTIIVPELCNQPPILQEACARLLNMSEAPLVYAPEDISILLARSGGQILHTRPSTAMLYMNYYQQLFPEIYTTMLPHFNDVNISPSAMTHKQQYANAIPIPQAQNELRTNATPL